MSSEEEQRKDLLDLDRVELDVQNVVVSDCESETKAMPKHDDSCKRDVNLDSTLEEAAKRRNLSALNVKSIIHVRNILPTLSLSLDILAYDC